MPLAIKSRKAKQRNSSGDPEEFRMPLAEHIGELRDRLIRSVLAICLGWAFGWFAQPWIYNHLNSVFLASVEAFQKTHPAFDWREVWHTTTEPFMFRFRTSFMIGLGVALPFIVLQIWGFVSPGLKSNERKPIKALAPASVVLFFMGCLFCWWILPLTFRWFLSYAEDYPQIGVYQEAGSMVMFILKMMFAFGLGFQLPLVVFIAGRIGIIGPDTLVHYWRHAVVFVFVTTAILTPSGDIFSMLMMAVPVSILLGISIFLVKVTSKRSRGEHDAVLDDLD